MIKISKSRNVGEMNLHEVLAIQIYHTNLSPNSTLKRKDVK